MSVNFIMFVSVSSSDRDFSIPLPLPLFSLLCYPLVISTYCIFKLCPPFWKKAVGKLVNEEVAERWDPEPELMLHLLTLYRVLRKSGSFDLVNISSGDDTRVIIKFK